MASAMEDDEQRLAPSGRGACPRTHESGSGERWPAAIAIPLTRQCVQYVPEMSHAHRKKAKRQARQWRARARFVVCPNCGAQMQGFVCSVPCDLYADQRWRTLGAPHHEALVKAVRADRLDKGCERCGRYNRELDKRELDDRGRFLDWIAQVDQPGTVDVHHLSYKRQGQPHEINDVLLLCRRCHNLIHERLERAGVVSPHKPRHRWGFPRQLGER